MKMNTLYAALSGAFLLGAATLGEVTRDLRESDHGATLVAQRRDDDVGPEARSVLAKPPPLVLEPAISRRGHELHFGLSGGDVLGGIERGEVPSDDLVRLISLEVRGAGVPREDVAARVEGEDGVVANAGDEETIELGGLVARLGAHRLEAAVRVGRRRHAAR